MSVESDVNIFGPELYVFLNLFSNSFILYFTKILVHDGLEIKKQASNENKEKQVLPYGSSSQSLASK